MSRTLKRHAARLLGFERLDPRLCLAVEAVLDGGLLTITGTPEDDTIVVRDNREGDIVVETRDPDNRFEPFEGVERIVINTLAGDDTVRYHVRRAASIPAEFNLGDGEDELSAHVSFARGDETDQAADLDIDSGAGDDDVQIRVSHDRGRRGRDDAGSSSIDLAIDLGDGNDDLRVGGHGASETAVDVTGGEGDDDVRIGLLLPAVHRNSDASVPSSLEVTADLGAGNDKLRLGGHGARQTTIDVAAGAGDDDVRIGLLLPAVHKLRETDATASILLDLGAGDDEFSLHALGVKEVDVDVTAGEGDDEVDIGLLLPARRTIEDSIANIVVDLGPGADDLAVKTRGYETVETDITGDEDDGDEVDLDVEPGPRPRPIPLPHPTLPRATLPPGRGR